MIKTECVIAGAGIAGVSAAIYARRSGLEFVLLEPGMVGGQLMYVGTVDNYPGLACGTKGQDIYTVLNASLRDLGVTVTGTGIRSVSPGEGTVRVVTDGGEEYDAGTVIVASGASMKRLGVPGEKEFAGKGVSYCAVCDGFFFRDKTVAVVGGGNSAVEEAVYLSRICKKVFLIHRRASLRALDYLQRELDACANVEILWDSGVREIKGKDLLEEVVVENKKTGSLSGLDVQGMFVAIGIEPNTAFLADTVRRDEYGFILTDEEMRSSVPNIFACGDCRRRPLRQLITAASEGAVAAISAYRYLKGHYISS